MGDGWKKGLGAYSGASAGLTRPTIGRPKRTLSPSDDPASNPLPRGGPPRHKPKSAGFDRKFNGGQKVKG